MVYFFVELFSFSGVSFIRFFLVRNKNLHLICEKKFECLIKRSIVLAKLADLRVDLQL